MIGNKPSSKKVIMVIVLLLIIIVGTLSCFSLSKKLAKTGPQTDNNQQTNDIASVSNQSTTTDNPTPTQQEPEKLTPVRNVPSTPKPAQEELDKINTSKWKTYTNTDYGYEIKYPADWSIIFRGDYQVHFLAPETPKFDPSAPGWGDVSIAMQDLILSSAPDQYFAKALITLNGSDGTLYTGVNCGQDFQNPDISCTIVDLAKDSREVSIEHFNELEKKDGAKYIGVYYKMLDTFRFVK